MAAIVFLEVDAEDRSRVVERFPDADVHLGALSGDALVEACSGARVVSCFIATQFTREVLQRLPDLRLVCTRSVGWNHIDLAACRERGITVCNVPDYGSHVIAEHVFALLLSRLRHIPEGGAKVQRGEFDYHGLRGITLQGKTLGIVGTGRIGRAVARIAHGFGMHILAVDKCRTVELEEAYGVRYVELPALLEQSDIITLHAPATPETRHMLNASSLAKAKHGVIIVNTARGDLIDSGALLQALQTGAVRYALLDVLEHEQVFEESRALIAHPNVVATPHIAFYAEESMKNMFDDCFASIGQWQAGAIPEHAVAPPTVICDLPGVSARKAKQ